MDIIEKALEKLSDKERGWVKEIIAQVVSGNWQGLNIQKLKGYADVFRVRKGDVRVVFRRDNNGKFFILRIERRSEKTYRGL